MKTYCVKCRTKTETNNEKKSKTKKGQPMMRGKCAVCETTKTRFVKKS